MSQSHISFSDSKLVEINSKNIDAIFDLAYATKNNVCGYELYSKPLCMLHEEAYEKLKNVVIAAKNLGLRLKIWDCYRPFEVQKHMFDCFAHDPKYVGFVSDPTTGVTSHCRGAAIDLTLTRQDGSELDMGTYFDDFTELAHHNCQKISVEAQKNRLILLGLMTICGFDFYSQEWWHYQLFNARNYPIVKLEELVSSRVLGK